MNLFLLRHASAGTRRLNPQLDVRRPLDRDGKQHCLQLAYVLNALKINFDAIVSSPRKRALQTAQLIATETGFETRIQTSNGLAPEALFADFGHLLTELKDLENVLVVGHNPNLQMFAGSLLMLPQPITPTTPIPKIRLRKGTLARFSVTRGHGGQASAVLQSMVDPRTVRALYATSTKSSRRKTSRK